jgi:hypothetical protein
MSTSEGGSVEAATNGRRLAWIAVGVAAALLVLAVMQALGPPFTRLFTFIATAALLLSLFGRTLCRDPVAFVSIAAPAMVLAGAAVVLVGRQRTIVALLALAWILLFIVGRNRLWAWWTQHVLRRRLPSPQREFDVAISEPINAYIASATDLANGSSPGEAFPAQAAASLEVLAGLTAPDAEWRQVQLDWQALMADGAGWAEGPLSEDVWRSHVEEMWRAYGRQTDLRGRAPEWSGPYPTLPTSLVSGPAAGSWWPR